jgi:alpha-glucosidase
MRLHDKAHSWDAVARLIPDMLAAGFVGCPFICPDMIGGGSWTAFLPGAPFDSELFIRSAQIHALCPMMQMSASPWRVLSKEHQRIFKKTAELRQKFAPRFVELAKESAKTGEPMMRNMEYCFPNMGYAYIKDQFMMGEDLLVAPVVEKGAASRKVVLPPGKWRADDGQVYNGPAEIEVATPLDRLPYFIKNATVR